MTEDDTLALLGLSLALARPTEPKVFCDAYRRNKWGHIAARCTMHAGHVDQDGNPNAHVDTHSGARWGAS